MILQVLAQVDIEVVTIANGRQVAYGSVQGLECGETAGEGRLNAIRSSFLAPEARNGFWMLLEAS